MRSQSRYIVRGMLPLVLTLCVVLAGFSLMIVRQNNFRSFQQKMDFQVQNVTAKKDLGELIVSNLRKVSTYYYMILLEKNRDRQNLLFADVQLTISEIQTALNILSDGGTLSRELPLSLPDKNASAFSISYVPKNTQHYNLEVLTLRPQLVVLEEKLRQTIDITVLRNRLLNSRGEGSLDEAIQQVRSYARHTNLQLVRMTENANKIAYDANRELMVFQRDIVVARKTNQHTEMLWVFMTVISVFGFIGLIYRQILFSQNKMESIILQLQQTEHELQGSHAEVLALNRSLEEQVAARTHELQLSEKQWSDAFNAVSSPIFLHDRAGKIIKANETYLQLAGCTLEAASEHYYWELFPRLDTPFSICMGDVENGAENFCAEETEVTVGEMIYRSRSFVINDQQGNYLYSMHLMDDVTAQEKYIEKLKKYEQILSTGTDLVAFFDHNHVFLAANAVYSEYFNVDSEEIVGKHAQEIVGSERYQSYLKYQDIIFDKKKTLNFKSWADYPKKGKIDSAKYT